MKLNIEQMEAELAKASDTRAVMQLNISVLSAYQLVLCIQLATKHPAYNEQGSAVVKEMLLGLARNIQDRLPFGVNMQKTLASGWEEVE